MMGNTQTNSHPVISICEIVNKLILRFSTVYFQNKQSYYEISETSKRLKGPPLSFKVPWDA